MAKCRLYAFVTEESKLKTDLIIGLAIFKDAFGVVGRSAKRDKQDVYTLCQYACICIASAISHSRPKNGKIRHQVIS